MYEMITYLKCAHAKHAPNGEYNSSVTYVRKLDELDQEDETSSLWTHNGYKTGAWLKANCSPWWKKCGYGLQGWRYCFRNCLTDGRAIYLVFSSLKAVNYALCMEGGEPVK